MKLLRCKICDGEVDIIDNEHAVNKKIKCTKCGFNNLVDREKKPIIIMRKRNIREI